MASLSNNQKTKRTTFLSSNPVMRRLDKVDEYAGADSKVCTYGGITVKTVFFLLFRVVLSRCAVAQANFRIHAS